MQVNTLTPRQASEMLAQGARLIDIRDAQEYAREHVAEATLAPLSAWQQGMPLTPPPSGAVIFMCQSGMRSDSNAALLASRVAPGQAYVMQGAGGLEAGRSADGGGSASTATADASGADRRRFIGVIGGDSGVWRIGGLFLLSAFVGAGLLFAGISGFCGMARLLMKMPWNRRMNP
ncbi:rhodanese family protein [Edwardsiella anguillarum]|nr:rhodanese family protein [Edwardsiella anguillarum]